MNCSCGLKEHIEKMIERCKTEKRGLENEGYTSISEQHLAEERFEYLDNLQGILQFIINHPEQEHRV